MHRGRLRRLHDPPGQPVQLRDLRRRDHAPLGLHLRPARRDRAQASHAALRGLLLPGTGPDHGLDLQEQAGQGPPRFLLRLLPGRLLRRPVPDRIHQGAAGRVRADDAPGHGSDPIHPLRHRRHRAAGLLRQGEKTGRGRSPAAG